MSKGNTHTQTDLVLEVTPPEVGHLKITKIQNTLQVFKQNEIENS